MIVEDEIRNAVTNFIIEKNSNDGIEVTIDLTDEVNFIGEGYIDSIIFIELLTYIEETFGIIIDMSKMNPNDLLSFGSFIRSIIRQGQMHYEKTNRLG